MNRPTGQLFQIRRGPAHTPSRPSSRCLSRRTVNTQPPRSPPPFCCQPVMGSGLAAGGGPGNEILDSDLRAKTPQSTVPAAERPPSTKLLYGLTGAKAKPGSPREQSTNRPCTQRDPKATFPDHGGPHSPGVAAQESRHLGRSLLWRAAAEAGLWPITLPGMWRPGISARASAVALEMNCVFASVYQSKSCSNRGSSERFSAS